MVTSTPSKWNDEVVAISTNSVGKCYLHDVIDSDDDWGDWNKSPSPAPAINLASYLHPVPTKQLFPPDVSPIKNDKTLQINDETLITTKKFAKTPYIISKKDLNIYPVRRVFYNEHPNVASLSRDEADIFLRQNNNIMVKELTTYLSNSKSLYENVNGDNESDNDMTEDSVEFLPGIPGIPKPVQSFEEAFWEFPDLLAIVMSMNFTKPSPIQCIGWPAILSGRDFIGIAQTGTGKTLTFVLPALIHIEGQTKVREFRRGPTVLILSPTRELAMQIEAEILKVNFHGIKTVCCYGGAEKEYQVYGLREKPEIVVGTPGRINDLVSMGYLHLQDVTYLVLDEADRMLDMGFEPQVVQIVNLTRVQRQSIMTSATWPNHVQQIALLYMNNPIQVNVGSLDLMACADVRQEIKFVENFKKTEELCNILFGMDENDKVIVFVTRKVQCRSLCRHLERISDEGIIGPYASVVEIHGDLSQDRREEHLSMFRDGECNVLIATNVASRGLDIADITIVVNYDFPKDIEEYVHRVGRTGRAGKQGKAITFMNDIDWKFAGELRNILIQSKQEVPPGLLNLRAMKPSIYKNSICDAVSSSANENYLTQSKIDNIKQRFNFDDDDTYQHEGSFDNSQHPSLTIGQKTKKFKTKGLSQHVSSRVIEYLDGVCEDIDGDYEDYFDEYQNETDPSMVADPMMYDVTGGDDDDVYEDWW